MYVNAHCSAFFGKRLKEIRTKSGLSQQTLSSELGVSKAALSYYESCSRVPDIEFLEKVSIYFDIPVDYLLGFTDAINPEKAPIVDKTGLSEEAIDILFEDRDIEIGIKMLDKLIKNEKFRQALALLEVEAHSSNTLSDEYEAVSTPARVYSNNIGVSFSAYLIERLIMDAIASVLEERHLNIGVELLNSLLSDKEKNEYFKWVLGPGMEEFNKKIAQFDNERKRDLEKDIRLWKEETKTREEAILKLKNCINSENNIAKGGDTNGSNNPPKE